MKNNVIVLAALAAIAGLVTYGYSVSSRTKAGPTVQTPALVSSQKTDAGEASGDAQTSNEGRVEVTVRPKNALAPEAKTWDFEVSLNTHSVELSEDLAQVSVLIDEQGKEYRPLSWTGAPPGGHHREGILSFEPIKSSTTAVRLEIRGVGGVAARAFSWKTAVK